MKLLLLSLLLAARPVPLFTEAEGFAVEVEMAGEQELACGLHSRLLAPVLRSAMSERGLVEDRNSAWRIGLRTSALHWEDGFCMAHVELRLFQRDDQPQGSADGYPHERVYCRADVSKGNQGRLDFSPELPALIEICLSQMNPPLGGKGES